MGKTILFVASIISDFVMWRKIIIIIVNTLITAVGVLLFILLKDKKDNLSVIIGVVGALISFNTGILSYWISSDKIFKELFSEFNKKYDEKFNDFLNDLGNKKRDEKRLFLIDDKGKCVIFTNEETKLVIDYLNFCSEEYFWKEKGRIDNKVWKSWEAGMHYFLKIGQIENIVSKEKENQADSYYGFLNFFDKKYHITPSSAKCEDSAEMDF